ncbi:MAG: hypothetical protein MUQ48_08125 [Pirellulales bacterium]|nr:hypothetical protein [Pirellulales bacterium]
MFQNLRASRATELGAEYPSHMTAAWLGHSTIVAQKHYWQVTDADFEKATKCVESLEEKAAQNAAQSVHARSRFDTQASSGVSHEEHPVLQELLHHAIPH